MHNPDFLAFKDSQTDIEFIVRNIDRKPINLTGRQLFATLVNNQSKRTIASIPLTIVDAARGIARLTLVPYMVKDIPLGFHRWTISYMLDNGNAKLLNVDQVETSHGYFEMRYGRQLQGIESQSAKLSEFHPVNFDGTNTYMVSPNFRGNLRNGSLDGLHTFAWYVENWTGSIWVEGSIVEQTPDEMDWFPILIDDHLETKLTNASGIIAHNLEMNLQWVRFKLRDHQMNHGEFKQILFRN